MFLIMQVLWKSFYINNDFKIYIFPKKPQTSLSHILWGIPCHSCVLMADSTYLHFLWRGRRAGWDFCCAAGFLESEMWINPLKWESRTIDEVCTKDNIRLFLCKEYKPHAETHLNDSLYEIFAYQEMRSIHAQFFYNRSRFRHSKLRWEKTELLQ